MDGRTTLLTGILAFILIGGGFLTLVVDNIEQDENKDDDSDSVEQQSDTTLSVDQFPSLLSSDYSKSWDGENITLSGFVTDESPSTCIVKIEVLDLCRPCRHLSEKLGRNNIIKEFLRKGGIRCQIMNDGKISLSDQIKII